MASFVALFRNPPDPSLDALSSLNVPKSGQARVGLWGYVDTSTGKTCTVKVVKGPGTAKAAEKIGSRVLVFNLSGLTDSSVLQAFSGDTPFTQPLPVDRSEIDGLAAENKQRLLAEDPADVAQINGRPVPVVPLAKGFGNYKQYPYMTSVNGLAVHITAGGGAANAQKGNFEARGVSTHFVIDRDGSIAQYIAAAFQSQAQGPGNPNFLSVEMVGKQDLKKLHLTQPMTSRQIATLSELFDWVYQSFSPPKWQLATVFVGKKLTAEGRGLGSGIDEFYQDMGNEFVSRGQAKASSTSIQTCINSVGLSCHWWLDNRVKSCPGVPMMSQMPQVLGYDSVALAGTAKYELT